jgi:hypothetical protein
VFAASLADDFVLSGPDYPEKDDPDGFIWGVRYSSAYPGLTYVAGGEHARVWAARLGRPMHEVLIETEAFRLRLVFADVRYAYLGTLDAPAVMRPKDMPIPSAADQRTADGNVQ